MKGSAPRETSLFSHEMNSTKDSSHGNKAIIGDYEFGMGLSFGTILAIVIITCASWRCFFHMRAARRNSAAATAATTTTVPEGLDEAALLALPKLLYSEAKPQKGDSIASGCSICLADFRDDHMLRQLPYCGHLFHVDCVDPWLRLQATCPICRDSPMCSGIHCRQTVVMAIT